MRRPLLYFYFRALLRTFAEKQRTMQYPEDNNIRGLRSVELSSMLPDLSISTSERLWVTVKIDAGTEREETVLEEWFYPVDGYVVLQDLRGLVEPYAYMRQTVTLQVLKRPEGGTDSVVGSATVVYCECDFGQETAEHYLANHFLSTLQGPKLTAIGRLEILPVQGSEAASCAATYSDGTTATFSVSTFLAPTSGRQFIEHDASPAQFVTEGKTLVSYVITAGNRHQQYIVDHSAPDCAPILIFYNSFGVEEVVYCTGTHRVDPSYKRSATYVGRRLRNYKIEETRSFKADTGPLTMAMANWLEDLFRSKCVRVANMYNGVLTPGKEVVITESKSSYTNDDDEVPRFTFTYQYGQPNHNVAQLERAGRIFDNTFDNTFE